MKGSLLKSVIFKEPQDGLTQRVILMNYQSLLLIKRLKNLKARSSLQSLREKTPSLRIVKRGNHRDRCLKARSVRTETLSHNAVRASKMRLV